MPRRSPKGGAALTHIGSSGEARMVDVSAKAATERVAVAEGRVVMSKTTLDLIRQVTRLQGPFDVPERPPEHDLDYRTHFERRTRLSGEPVFRAEFLRR